jgi:hypothetical protein
MHFIFFLWSYQSMSCNVQWRSLPGNPISLYMWLRVGDLNSFIEIIGLFLLKGMSMGPPCIVMTTYHHMFPDIRNKNTHGLWLEMSIIFKMLEHLWCREDGTIPWGNDQHAIQCALTQGTRIYGWKSERFSLYLSTSSLKEYRTTPYGHYLA